MIDFFCVMLIVMHIIMFSDYFTACNRHRYLSQATWAQRGVALARATHHPTILLTAAIPSRRRRAWGGYMHAGIPVLPLPLPLPPKLEE